MNRCSFCGRGKWNKGRFTESNGNLYCSDSCYEFLQKMETEDGRAEIKKSILGSATDKASDFMFYDRKEDEDLPSGSIEMAIEKGVVTYEEIVSAFREGMDS